MKVRIKVRQVLSQLQVTVRLLHPGHHQVTLWTTIPCSGGVGVRRPPDPREPFSVRFGQAGEVPCLCLPAGAVYLPLQLSEQCVAERAAPSWKVARALLGIMCQQVHPGLASPGEQIHLASRSRRAEFGNKETWSNSWLCSISPSFHLGQG